MQQSFNPERTDIPGTRTVSVTPAKKAGKASAPAAKAGRVPSGKRARKHNVRRG